MQASHKIKPGANSKPNQGTRISQGSQGIKSIQNIRGLYVIADTGLLLDSGSTVTDLIQAVTQAITGGARLVQLRHKSNDASTDTPGIESIARELQKLCRDYGVIFIINDHVQLAADIQADGVHLGQEDMPINKARKILGDQAIIGVTCHNQLSLALEAQKQGADYVAFGSFFSSPTKPDAVRAPLTLAREARDLLTLPIVAIGGITPDNAEPLIATGISAIAVASGVFAQTDIKAAAQAYCKLF